MILEAGDLEIPVHRLVMASGSPYFMAMFNGNNGNVHVCLLQEKHSLTFICIFCKYSRHQYLFMFRWGLRSKMEVGPIR